MEKRVVLCVDELSLREPAMIGLSGEVLCSYRWLECSTDAWRCRDAAARLPSVEEVWVVSCDDMELINVAAAIKRDDPTKRVYLACRDGSGSMASRAANAGIDGLWSQAQFLRRFAQVKGAFSEEGNRRQDEGDEPTIQMARVDSPSHTEPSFRNPQARDVLSEPNPPCSASFRKTATVIAVVSGSGGCGKSTIAAVFAGLAARSGLSTIVVDADLQFGDMHRLLGAEDPLRMEDALAAPNRLSRLGDDSREGIALLAAPRRIELSEEVAPQLPSVLDRVASLCDVAVVNTGAFWSDAQACVLDAADAVAFLMDSRPASLHAAVHAVELCARMGLATASFSFVVNRHGKSSMLSAVDASCSLRGAHAIELPDGGRDVDELLGSGYVSELLESGNVLPVHAERLLGSLLPAEKRDILLRAALPAARKRRSLFRRGS